MTHKMEWNTETQQRHDELKKEYHYYEHNIFHYKEYCIECKEQNKKPLHPTELIRKRDEVWPLLYPLIILKRKATENTKNRRRLNGDGERI